MIRAALVAAILLVAVLVTPYALAPGFNSADVIWFLAPVGILTVGWPHRSRAPQSAVEPPGVAGRRGAVTPNSAPRRP